jgi:hypothetical protein
VPNGLAAILTEGIRAADNERELKLVSGVIPVNPVELLAVIFPFPELVLSAWTCKPVIVNASTTFVPVPLTFIVKDVLVNPSVAVTGTALILVPV